MPPQSGKQSVGAHIQAPVADDAEQGRRVLDELALVGMAQIRIQRIHSREQSHINLVFKRNAKIVKIVRFQR